MPQLGFLGQDDMNADGGDAVETAAHADPAIVQAVQIGEISVPEQLAPQ